MVKKICIVEDDNIYSEFLKKSLRTKYKIYAYYSAEDAILALRSIVPDVLIIDYKLPGMNGMELFENVKGNLPATTKVVVLSAIDDGNLVLDFIKRGIRDYVIKDDNVISSLISIIEDDEDVYYDSGLDA
ncbi:MAG: response regulator [Bacteroidetes bacterium]|nr:response regulator [Bacteroidota bacterium]